MLTSWVAGIPCSEWERIELALRRLLDLHRPAGIHELPSFVARQLRISKDDVVFGFLPREIDDLSFYRLRLGDVELGINFVAEAVCLVGKCSACGRLTRSELDDWSVLRQRAETLLSRQERRPCLSHRRYCISWSSPGDHQVVALDLNCSFKSFNIDVLDIRPLAVGDFSSLLIGEWQVDDETAWCTQGEVVRLGSHYHSLPDPMAILEGPRSAILSLVDGPNGFALPLTVPSQTGRYIIEVDAAIEFHYWGSARGVQPLIIQADRSAEGTIHFECIGTSHCFDIRDLSVEERNVLEDPPRVDLFGRRLFLDPLDQMVSPMLALGVFEPFEAEVFRRLVPIGGTVIDLGANLGYFTLLAADAVGPAGRVEAFEPNPRNFSLLTRSIAENDLKNVTAHRYAVARSNGKRTLFLSSTNGGGHSLFQFDESEFQQEVNGISLDEFFGTSLARLDVIKSDTQGAEHQILAGAESLLHLHPGAAILCEFWPGGLRRAGGTPEGFLQFIHDTGRECLLIDGERRCVRHIDDCELLKITPGEGFVNLVCHPRQGLTTARLAWLNGCTI